MSYFDKQNAYALHNQESDRVGEELRKAERAIFGRIIIRRQAQIIGRSTYGK